MEALLLHSMSFQRKHEAYGHVRIVAGDDCRVVVEQCSHHTLGNGYLSMVKNDKAYILDWYCGLLFRFVVVWFQLDNQLAVAKREIGRMRETECALNHIKVSIFSYMNDSADMVNAYFHNAFKIVGGFYPLPGYVLKSFFVIYGCLNVVTEPIVFA